MRNPYSTAYKGEAPNVKFCLGAGRFWEMPAQILFEAVILFNGPASDRD